MANRDLLADVPRQLRERQTRAEELMWRFLRSRRFRGLKFRRQHRITNYIADFYCHELKLIVELDGKVHSTSEQADHDDNRDFYLQSLGYRIVRFPNREIFENIREVLQQLGAVVEELQPSVSR